MTSLDISSSGQGMAAGYTSNLLLINSGVITQVNCGSAVLINDVISTGSGAGYIVTSSKTIPLLYTNNSGVTFTIANIGGLLMWNNRTNIPLFVGLKLTPSAKDNQ